MLACLTLNPLPRCATAKRVQPGHRLLLPYCMTLLSYPLSLPTYPLSLLP